MTKAQMKALRPGDRVLWVEEKIPGTVKRTTRSGVTIDYDDGLQNITLAYNNHELIDHFKL
ncbi:MAG: hypothetical protein ACLQVL_19860 [Terriglobia bacterium]